MKKISILLPVIFLISSCIVGKNAKTIDAIKQNVETVAKNNFGNGYKILFNKNYDYAVVYKKVKSAVGDKNMIKIMVYDCKNKEVLWGKKAIKAKLQWDGKYKLRINYITKAGKPATIVYDAKNKQVSYIQ